MKAKTYLLLLGFLLILQINTAQNFKLEQVNKSEVEMTEDPVFKDVDAIVLQRNVKTVVGKYIEVYEKIKILSNDGLEYATVEVPYLGVFKLEGATYNIEGGELQKTPLKKDMIFEEKTKIKRTSIVTKKASLPKVKVGSVIEIHYKASKGTSANIDMQYFIPIKKLHVVVNNTSWSTYRIVQNPRAYLDVTRNDTGAKVNIRSVNIPALERESHVYDIDLYRAQLILKWIGGINSTKFGSWFEIGGFLSKTDEYTKHLKPKGVYKEQVETLIAGIEDPLKKAEKIYDYIKENIVWNKERSIFPESGSRLTFRKQEGDLADINNLYVSMLNSIGIEACPVLASTKSNGVHVTASWEAFNYTLAGAKIGDKWYVFDAANPRATFDYIPEYLINWEGMAIKSDKTIEWVNLTRPKVSKNQIMAKAAIDEDFVLTGNVKERKTGYYGIDLKLQTKDSEVKKDSLVGVNVEGLQYSNINVNVKGDSDKSVLSYDFIMEDAVELIGDDLHLSPLFFMSLAENPFKKETRQYPIDFGYPFTRHYVFTIDLPENYEPEFIPAPIRVALPNNGGSYFFNIASRGSSIAVIMKFDIKTAIFSQDEYFELKEFYKMRMEKENEKVILKLKS